MTFKNPTAPTLEELNSVMSRRGGSLDLRGTAITSLPEGLTVGGSLDLSGTAIPVVYADIVRDYRLRRVKVGDAGEWWTAGCRLFEGRAEALAHWGGDNYPDKRRGWRYCDAINSTPVGWNDRD